MRTIESAPIGEYTTFRLGGRVRVLFHAESEADIMECAREAKRRNLPLVILGEGSNVIFKGDAVEVAVAKMELKGFSVLSEDNASTSIMVGAGERWDDVVARTVDMGLAGIEAMSAIPGTAGATPVQNVGAYGQEIRDTLVSVRAYDTRADQFVALSNQNCKFGYRDSIFRSSEKGRYIIASVVLRLSKGKPTIPKYPDLERHFAEKHISTPTVQEIREAVIAIRRAKLPDPKVTWNAGSFFKNPVLRTDDVEHLKRICPDVPTYPAEKGMTKVSAGWLIERAGLKGKDFGRIRVYERNALVLVNKGDATYSDLLTAQELITREIRERFGVALESEPVLVG